MRNLIPALALLLPASASAQNWWPLAEGNYWTYERSTGFDWTQIVYDSETFNGLTYYTFQSESPFQWVRLDDQQRMWFYEPEGDVLWLDFGAPVGTLWTSYGGTYVLQDRDVLVTTPAGTFGSCVEISRSDLHTFTSYVWYCPTVGPVRYWNVSSGTAESLLKEYGVAVTPVERRSWSDVKARYDHGD